MMFWTVLFVKRHNVFCPLCWFSWLKLSFVTAPPYPLESKATGSACVVWKPSSKLLSAYKSQKNRTSYALWNHNYVKPTDNVFQIVSFHGRITCKCDWTRWCVHFNQAKYELKLANVSSVSRPKYEPIQIVFKCNLPTAWYSRYNTHWIQIRWKNLLLCQTKFWKYISNGNTIIYEN